MKPVFNLKDTRRLRRFFDTIESNYRGLQALQVDEQTYAAIVVPSVFEQITREAVRLTITRGQKYLEWSMKEFVEARLAEVELRESHQLTTGEEKMVMKRPTTSPNDGECLVCEERRTSWMRVLPWKPQP